MIKFLYIALTVTNFPDCGIAADSKSLKDDIEDFIDLLNFDYMIDLTSKYYLNDMDFQSMMEYLQSDQFSVVWKGFFGVSVVRDLAVYLTSEGIPVYDYEEIVGNFIGQPPVNSRISKHSIEVKHDGLKGYVERLLVSLPLEEWSELYKIKQESSARFKELLHKLRKINLMEFKQFYKDNKECRTFMQILRSHGIQVEQLERNIKTWIQRGKFPLV